MTGPVTRDQPGNSAGGFVAIYRRLLDHPLWTQFPPEWLKAWIYILLRANHKPCTWWDGTQEIEIPDGGLVTSIEKLAAHCRITRRQARGSLEYFERAGMVTRQTSHRHSIITITNWGAYQFVSSIDGTPNGTLDGKLTARKRHAGRQTDGTLDGNSTTNKQLTSKDSCPSDDGRSRELFSVDDPPFNTLDEPAPVWGVAEKQRAFQEEFWPAWPRKIAKAEAERAWCKRATSREQADSIIKALGVQLLQLSAARASEDGKDYCPYPATWLNGERYEDDPETQPSQSNGSIYPDYREASE
jgi:hypothetical protein